MVTFKHPDPRIVQPVLQEVINDYSEKHKEIHSAGGLYDDALSREQSTLSVALNDTEKKIADLKSGANIGSLDGAKKDLADRIAKIQGSILDARAALAGYEATTKQNGSAPPGKLEATNSAPAAIPSDQIDAYNGICASLDALRKKEQDYLLQGWTKSNKLVMEVDAQLANTQKAKGDLEKKYPQITSLGTAWHRTRIGQSSSPAVDLRTQVSQAAAIQARLEFWNGQLDQLQMQATNLNSLEPVDSAIGTGQGNPAGKPSGSVRSLGKITHRRCAR